MSTSINTNESVSMKEEDGIDLSALWNAIVRRKWLITALSLLGGAVAAGIALSMTPVFRSEATITHVMDAGGGGAMSIGNQIGGLASLAGINLGGDEKSQTALAVLKSRNLAEEFIKRNDLQAKLYEGEASQPSLWRTVQSFRKNVVAFREDKRAGTVIVSMDWKDPENSALWANKYIALANEILRGRAMEESSRNIAYLNAQLAKTEILEVRRAMFNIIESETKTLMLANARTEYAFSVVDPAVAPEMRVSPQRTVMTLFGLLVGFLVGTAVSYFWRRGG